jgi:hypothetical protein
MTSRLKPGGAPRVPRALLWLAAPDLLLVLIQGLGWVSKIGGFALTRAAESRVGDGLLISLAAPPALVASIIIAVITQSRAGTRGATVSPLMWPLVLACALVNLWMYSIFG